MIQITDYRVGNYLWVDRVLRRICLINADEGFDGAPYIGFQGNDAHPYERCSSTRLEAAPLSDELLLQVGFSPASGARLLHTSFAPGCYILEVEGSFDGERGAVHTVRRRVGYLHQLQNLYFALTGSELRLVPAVAAC